MYMSQSREALSTVPNHTVSRVALASLPPPGGGFLGSGTHLHLSVPQHLPRSHVALVYLKMLWPLASSGRAAWSTCYLLGNPSGCASGPLRVVCSSAGSLLICVMLTGTSPLAPPGGKDEDGHAPALGGTSLSIPGLRGGKAWRVVGACKLPVAVSLAPSLRHTANDCAAPMPGPRPEG